MNTMIDTYLIFKSLHLISMVAWFAGLFYLPRLFVYHVENPKNAPMLQVMEYKLARFIMLPAAIGTLLFGMGMVAISPEVMQMSWIHAKLGCVLLVIAYHASLEFHRLNLASGRNRKSSKFFRLYNEVPTVLLIAIIFLAVIKPY